MDTGDNMVLAYQKTLLESEQISNDDGNLHHSTLSPVEYFGVLKS